VFDPHTTVGSNVDGLPLGLNTVQWGEDALAELLLRADEVSPEVTEVALE